MKPLENGIMKTGNLDLLRSFDFAGDDKIVKVILQLNIIFLIYRSEYTEGWYQDENGDWYQADPTEGKKPSTTGRVNNSTLRINIYLSIF